MTVLAQQTNKCQWYPVLLSHLLSIVLKSAGSTYTKTLDELEIHVALMSYINYVYTLCNHLYLPATVDCDIICNQLHFPVFSILFWMLQTSQAGWAKKKKKEKERGSGETSFFSFRCSKLRGCECLCCRWVMCCWQYIICNYR